MPSVMADHDVEGQFKVLLRVLMSDVWRDFWIDLGYQIESFENLGIATNTADVQLWRLCQERDIVLITGNRKKEGAESLEATIEQCGIPERQYRKYHPVPVAGSAAHLRRRWAYCAWVCRYDRLCMANRRRCSAKRCRS